MVWPKIMEEMSIIREEGVCFFTHDDAKAVIECGVHNSVEAIGKIQKKRLGRFLFIRRAKVLCLSMTQIARLLVLSLLRFIAGGVVSILR